MADIEKHKQIAKDQERLRGAIAPSIEALQADPADLAAIARFQLVLQAEMPCPSDLFRALIAHYVAWYDETLLPDAPEDKRAAFRAAQTALSDIGKSLETPAPEPLLRSEAELRALGIAYSRRADGMLEVADTIDLKGRKLEQLPDLSNVVVLETFFADANKLKSLAGSPFYVGELMSASNNALETLAGAPAYVGEDFIASSNSLNNLQGGPTYVGATYVAGMNLLTSLQGVPAEMKGILFVRDNPRLKHLEHAPKIFKEMQTDFGDFKTADKIPEELRLSAETRDIQSRTFRELMAEITKRPGSLSRPVSAPKTASFARKS